MRFSQRMGLTPVRTQLQIDAMDDDLRNEIWNAISQIIFSSPNIANGTKQEAYRLIWRRFFRKPVDEAPIRYARFNSEPYMPYLRDWFMTAQWYEIYDLVEFLVMLTEKIPEAKLFTPTIVKIMKREMSGYTLINSKIVPITSESEIESIESAVQLKDTFAPVSTHIEKALGFFADRKNPDYDNSIKESISAVESICRIACGNSKLTLGDGVTAVGKKYNLHGALTGGFSKLYGYASDQGGIRHGSTGGESETTADEAKLMLILCSGFVNYVKSKMIR